MRTTLEIFDTLSDEQKHRVYQIIGDILENNRKIDVKYVNLNFLSNHEQRELVYSLINQAIADNRKE